MGVHDREATNLSRVAIPIVMGNDNEWLRDTSNAHVIFTDLLHVFAHEVHQESKLVALNGMETVAAGLLVSESFEVLGVLDYEEDEFAEVILFDGVVGDCIVVDALEEEVLELLHDVLFGGVGIDEGLEKAHLLGGGRAAPLGGLVLLFVDGGEVMSAIGRLVVVEGKYAVLEALRGVLEAGGTNVEEGSFLSHRGFQLLVEDGAIFVHIKVVVEVILAHAKVGVPDNGLGGSGLLGQHNYCLFVKHGLLVGGQRLDGYFGRGWSDTCSNSGSGTGSSGSIRRGWRGARGWVTGSISIGSRHVC